MGTTYDVAIIGGGIAGLSLAIQLLRAEPELSVFICDKRSSPYPVDRHKVGEALVEGGSFYLREILGVEEHLRQHHIVKTGLRFYLPRASAQAFDQRPEIGTDSDLPMTTYIIERSPFENHLAEVARSLGATIAYGATIESYERDQGDYQLNVVRDDSQETLSSRWLIDASGRRAVIRKKHGLTADSMHTCAASWFRIEKVIDPHNWSDRSEWRERVPAGMRRNATNHLLGDGYWIWMIPIKTGATSIGLVIDSDIVPLSKVNVLDRLLDWLGENEPTLRDKIGEDKELISGFGTYKNVSYSTQQVFSPERWCLTGEAATFTDPLYSSGLDLIGIANTMITRLILSDRAGSDVTALAGFMNDIYLRLYDVLMSGYRGMYHTFGNARIFATKTAWDFTLYVSLPLGLFRYAKLFDPAFMQSFGPKLDRAISLTKRMQALFRAWAEQDDGAVPLFAPCHAELESVDRLERLYRDAPPSDDKVEQIFHDNVILLEETALEIFNRVTDRLGIRPDQPAKNPYAISLDPKRWESDGLFTGHDVRIRDCVQRDVDRFWA